MFTRDRRRAVLAKVSAHFAKTAQGNKVQYGVISGPKSNVAMPTFSFGPPKASTPTTEYTFEGDRIEGSTSGPKPAAAPKPAAQAAPKPAQAVKPKKPKMDPKRFDRLMGMIKSIPKPGPVGAVPPTKTPKPPSSFGPLASTKPPALAPAKPANSPTQVASK